MSPVFSNSMNKYTSGHEFRNTSEGFFSRQLMKSIYSLLAHQNFYKT